MFSNLSLGETMLVTVTGIIIVFLVLFLLILIISLFGKVASGAAKREKKQPKAEKPAIKQAPSLKPAPQKAAVQAIDDSELIAVITAAAMCALGNQAANYAVKSIRESGGRPVWATAGLLKNTRAF